MQKSISNCHYQKQRQNQSGFSLVEILVVLVIIGLLTSIVAVNVLDEAEDAQIQKVKAEFKNIETALDMYRLDNYSYPTTEQGLRALVEKPSLDPVPKNWKSNGYLKRLPKDPWENEYRYLSPGEHGDFDLYSLGRDNVPGGEGVDADIGNWQEGEDAS